MRASLSLRSDRIEFGRLVTFAEGFARRHAIPSAERARLAIILEELFINSVYYGHGGAASSCGIERTLAIETGHLQIEFRDDGRPFGLLNRTLSDLDQPTVRTRIWGSGRHIARSLVDDARYSRVGDRNHTGTRPKNDPRQ